LPHEGSIPSPGTILLRLAGLAGSGVKRLDTISAIHPSDKEILSKLGQIVRWLLPGATICLFGGAAKGRREPDSDLDVLIISSGPLSRQEEAVVADAIYGLELANGVVISTLLYSREEWEAPLARATPFQARLEAEATLL
jgi:predicted nucleotidyltransferase